MDQAWICLYFSRFFFPFINITIILVQSLLFKVLDFFVTRMNAILILQLDLLQENIFSLKESDMRIFIVFYSSCGKENIY